MIRGGNDLLAAAKEAGVRRFVLMSALGTREDTKDLVPYYRAKWEVEQAVKGSGIDHVIFQPSFIFGRDGGIIPTFRRLVKVAPVTPVIGSGERHFQPIWVDDVATYFEQAIDLESATNRSFELGGPEQVTWNEFWARFKRALGIRRRSVHVPVGLMRVNALLTERLPGDIPLTRDLLKMLESGDNVGLRNAAVEALGAFSEPAVQALSEKAPSLDADGKKLAAEALARTLLPSALDALRPLLIDEDPNVRAAALDSIASVGTSAAPEAFEILAGSLTRPFEIAFVRLSALDGINRLGSLLPWPVIEGMLQDPVLERSAFAAAGRSAHPEALSALLSALERARGGGVSVVLAALVEYSRTSAQNLLLVRAEPPSPAVVTRLLELAAPKNDDLVSRKAALIVSGALGIDRIAPIAAEAQQLLSPAEMGELFKVLAVGRGVKRPLLGFSRGERSHTL